MYTNVVRICFVRYGLPVFDGLVYLGTLQFLCEIFYNICPQVNVYVFIINRTTATRVPSNCNVDRQLDDNRKRSEYDNRIVECRERWIGW